MRNKFGYPFVFDTTKRQDARRLANVDYMIKNGPVSFKKIWEKKKKELKDIINARKENRKNLN